MDRLDLYLVHWPQGGASRAWPGMERTRELGLAASIGVSNFGTDELDEVAAGATMPPVVNQVMFNVASYRRALLEACLRRSIVLEAYSPLGTGRHLSNGTVTSVAESAGRTPAQVLLRWCLQHDVPVITKSTHRDRLQENAQVFDFALSSQEMAELDAIGADDSGGAQEHKWW